MAGETRNSMNIDLNLGPVDGNNDDTRHRQRRYDAWQHIEDLPEARNFAVDVIGDGGGLQAGEGSVTTESRSNEGMEICENNNGYKGNGATGKKDIVVKGNEAEMSFFDCNVCLGLAKDPVVTCCGHLFCWPCLYRWLHIHSQDRECPVCKGEVTVKNVTPIYGRGSSTREREDDAAVKIPIRPQARRVESWWQAIRRSPFAVPMEQIIRRRVTRFDLSRDLNQLLHNAEDPQGTPVSSLVRRIMTSRGLRREHESMFQPENAIESTETSSPDNLEAGESRLDALLHRRSSVYRTASISNLTSGLISAEGLIGSYFQSHPVGTNQDRPQPVDNRDSMSSIAAAVTHSGNQTVDTVVDIESNVTRSTSSSRRRNEQSRIEELDSGESRTPRRRRLH